MISSSRTRLGNAFFAGLSCLLILELAHGYPKGDAARGGSSSSITHIETLIPEYPTDHAEMYLCTSVLLPDEPLKLVGVEPLSKEEVVHHMLLFGCAQPAAPDRVWDCHTHSVCAEAGSHVLYGWAKGADAMHLPAGVGYRVGQGTGSRHLVLQVHYTQLRPPGDQSGVRLKLTDDVLPFSAGMMMYASFFQIPPLVDSHLVPTRCCYAGFEPAHGFAYRVHTHALGRSVYMDRIETTGERTRLVEHSPQLPQGFTPVGNLTFWPGETLEATCNFNSLERETVTSAGSTHHDEMCNLYMMMWSELPVFMTCSGGGTWNDNAYVDTHGPGGIPVTAQLVAEAPQHWRPPPPFREGHSGKAPQVGQVAGVAKGHQGTIWVFHRAGRIWDGGSFADMGAGEKTLLTEPIKESVVLQLDQESGEVLSEWGAGEFLLPHMITVDKEGNVWTTDVALHVATKWSPSGTELLELGQRSVPGHDKEHLCKPTQVAVANDGRIFVGDGYCNSRVVEYSAGGQWQGEFVLPSTAGEPLRNPHSIVLQECAHALYVAEREASRVHRFSLETRELEGTWDLSEYGPVYALTVGPYGAVFALSWNRDAVSQPTTVAWLDTQQVGKVGAAWAVPGVHAPHDMVAVASPVRLAGKERPLALLIAETWEAGNSRLHKFIILPEGEELPVEADPQLVTARSQWQQVVGMGSGGVDASRTVKTGTFLGKFIGLKQIHSADRDLRSSIMQMLLVGLPLTALVGGMAFALWRLAGPVSLRPAKDVSANRPSPFKN